MPAKKPYSQFSFIVEFNGVGDKSVHAGFLEVAGFGMEVAVAEYRAVNDKTDEPVKVSGTARTSDVALKRGLIDTQEFYEWLENVRKGLQEQFKTVTIMLLNEDRKSVMKWQLSNVRPIKYSAPSTDLAIEEQMGSESNCF